MLCPVSYPIETNNKELGHSVFLYFQSGQRHKQNFIIVQDHINNFHCKLFHNFQMNSIVSDHINNFNCKLFHNFQMKSFLMGLEDEYFMINVSYSGENKRRGPEHLAYQVSIYTVKHSNARWVKFSADAI